jgi:hypothetical protein
VSQEKDIEHELEKLKQEKIISERTAQVYLSDVRKKIAKDEDNDVKET